MNFKKVVLTVIGSGFLVCGAQAQQTKNSVTKEQVVVPQVGPENPMEEGVDKLMTPASPDIANTPDAEILSAITNTYKIYVKALDAQLNSDALLTETYLLSAVDELELMIAEYPDLVNDKRFYELLRSVKQEHRLFYGISDSVDAVQGDIFAVLEEAMESFDEAVVIDYDLPERVHIKKTQIPLTQNNVVNQFLVYFTQRRPQVMETWLKRSQIYFPMIEKIFKEEGLPEEAKYLAMIESGLVPHARSGAAAVGMWQFIAATGKSYGLEVNWWVDERRNPEKATRAAARHLKDLYGNWKDWHLALAGYNISPRGLKRAIRAAGGQKDYWAARPYLPRETRSYVPQYIAAAIVASNPEEFGFQSHYEDVEIPEYEVQYVDGLMNLKDLAACAGISTKELQELNPELVRFATPPGQKYPLRIPKDKGTDFLAAYKDLPKNNNASGVMFHVVSRGESLGKIANKYGTSVRSLYEINTGLSQLIRPGQKIAVPLRQGGVTNIAANRPSNSKSSSSKASSSSKKSNYPAPPNTSKLEYTVKKGDTIGHIADWYDVYTWKVRAWNNTSNWIKPGQKLVVYVPKAKAHLYEKIDGMSKSEKSKLRKKNSANYLASAAGSSVSSTKSSSTQANGSVVYTVKRNDTLIDIAQSFDTTVSQIRTLNNLKGSRIYPGQTLVIKK